VNHHSTPWHPWRDKPGSRHIPTYFKHGEIWSPYCDTSPLFLTPDLQHLTSTVCQNGLFLLVHDILNEEEFPYANELIGKGTPYFTKAGNVTSMSLKQGRKTGVLVPARTWQWDMEPNRQITSAIQTVWRLFGYEASTPSSLSEKVLRATLPDYVGIYRPSIALRRDVLANSEGGRIDKAIPAYYKEVKEYDKNKAYLFHSRYVPSPYLSPVFCGKSSLDRIMAYPVGFWHMALVANDNAISPIQLDGNSPVAGEVFEKWLWTGEIVDCLEAGYQFLSCSGGYGFREMSNFMEEWSDILWAKYEEARAKEDPCILNIIKAMMVGLPGRFLRKPESFTLIPFSEIKDKKTDTPLMLHSQGKRFSDWAIRSAYDKESTALSYIGSYIVSEMRRELYHRMKEETEHGYLVIGSYIDSYRLGYSFGNTSYQDMATFRQVGTGLGQWKLKRVIRDAWAEENRIVGLNAQGIAEVTAPGYEQGGRRRLAFLQKYRMIMENQHV
jgi:hypothetical protein